MRKVLVAYFSASGTTERVACDIARATGGDLYEIAPQAPYTAADLDWRNSQSRTSLEHADDACRPALAAELPDTAGYDAVFVGFPIWWYVEPRIVDTFVEGADLANKVVIPFATSGGSGIGRAEERLHGLCPGSAWRPGKLLNGVDAGAWAGGLAL